MRKFSVPRSVFASPVTLISLLTGWTTDVAGYFTAKIAVREADAQNTLFLNGEPAEADMGITLETFGEAKEIAVKMGQREFSISVY